MKTNITYQYKHIILTMRPQLGSNEVMWMHLCSLPSPESLVIKGQINTEKQKPLEDLLLQSAKQVCFGQEYKTE